MEHADPLEKQELAICTFHKRNALGQAETLRVNPYYVVWFEECPEIGCNGTRLYFVNGFYLCVLEDVYTTTLKLSRERRPFHEQLAARMRSNEHN